jgi:tRNA nucleotidyltransferase (CCA-adding enzyme)
VSQYLQSVLTQQTVGIVAPLNALYHFTPILHQWGNSHVLDVKLSGSNAKGTAVKCSADVDLFISIATTCPNSLSEIYNALFVYFVGPNGYNPRKQNVSIRVNFSGGTVDLVPVRILERVDFGTPVFS